MFSRVSLISNGKYGSRLSKHVQLIFEIILYVYSYLLKVILMLKAEIGLPLYAGKYFYCDAFHG